MANGDRKGGLVSVTTTRIATNSTTKTLYTHDMGQNSVARIEVVFVAQRLNNSGTMTFRSLTTINSNTSTATVRSGPTDVDDQGSGLVSAISPSGLSVDIQVTANSGAPWRIAAWVYIYELEQQYLAI